MKRPIPAAVVRWFRGASGAGSTDGGAALEPDGGTVSGSGGGAARAHDRPDASVSGDPATPEALVDDVFDRLDDELGPEAADALETARRDLRTGLERAEFGSTAGDTAGGPDGETRGAVAEPDAGTPDAVAGLDADSGPDYHQVLHHIGTPLFVLDADGEILTWNSQLEGLTGVAEAEAQAMEMASMAFYPDGRRGKTLADKVIDAPERTDEVYDVPRVEDAGFTLYRDTSVMLDQNDEEVHISFSAAPVYDEDGDLLAVVEMVQDRTSDVLRHEHTTDLVTELEETMRSIRSGNLDARAEFDNDEGHVEESLLAVVGELNEMADSLQDLIRQVDDNATDLAAATDQSADAAVDIEEAVVEQNEILAEATDDVQEVSATMEEIAATSNEVAQAASSAKAAVEDGADASEQARLVTDGLTDTSEALVDDVTELEERMDEVSEITEIIADVAEQTNMLALNANIEAARAGESGSGFAVVAEEVKTLANETGEYADRISSNVAEIQDQATATVGTVEESNEQIAHAEEQISAALAALDDVADAVDRAADGIEEVADSNDGQAEAIEGVTATIEDARTHAEAAEAAAGQIVDATESQTRSVDELVDSIEQLHDDRS
jgi:methyl-accepting chemotaxis protein